jgi:predicted cation transporter
LGAIIGVIIESLSGGIVIIKGNIPNIIPKIKGEIKEWINKLGKLLSNLAGKAAAALPGIIGSKC